jgi:uncharacterized protein DUF5985
MGSVNFVLTGLAVLTSIACTVFLLRAYAQNQVRLLLWSGLCFIFLSINNVLVFLDFVVFPEVDLRPYRLLAALVGLLFLLYGFVWESE